MEELAVSIGVRHLHPVKVGHFLVAYVRRRQAEVQRPNRTDFPCQWIGLRADHLLD